MDEMNNNDVIVYTHKGELKIGYVTIQCYVGKDKNGQIKRVISGRSLTRAIDMKGRGPGARSRLAKHKTLLPYFSQELVKAIENPIQIVGGPGSRRTKPSDGYEATKLLDICQGILDARNDNALKTVAEKRYAIASEAIVRSMAKVGIIALVDEATGYQEDRDRNELQKILEKYIAEELRPWVKRFPDDYYEQLFRLKGWQYKPLSVNRPKLVGKITNTIVYQRMPPGVLEELQKKNPKNDKGNRSHKHHQYLTEQYGVTHLEKHLAGTIALMRAASTWRNFMSLLNKAYPPRDPYQPTMFDMDDEENE